MKKFLNEFKDFALRGNIVDMAVGVIIGAAFKDIVTSLTTNFINPILNFFTGAARYNWSDIAGFASAFITAVINFLIMAFILFCIVKGINTIETLATKKKRDQLAAAPPTTKVCPFCKSEIPVDATRCAHCTSQLED